MKSPESTEQAQEILSEYHFDYSKAKPNRFATVQPQTQVENMIGITITKLSQPIPRHREIKEYLAIDVRR